MFVLPPFSTFSILEYFPGCGSLNGDFLNNCNTFSIRSVLAVEVVLEAFNSSGFADDLSVDGGNFTVFINVVVDTGSSISDDSVVGSSLGLGRCISSQPETEAFQATIADEFAFVSGDATVGVQEVSFSIIFEVLVSGSCDIFNFNNCLGIFLVEVLDEALDARFADEFAEVVSNISVVVESVNITVAGLNQLVLWEFSVNVDLGNLGEEIVLETFNSTFADKGAINKGNSAIGVDEVVGAGGLVHCNCVVSLVGYFIGVDNRLEVFNEALESSIADNEFVIRNSSDHSVAPNLVLNIESFNFVENKRSFFGFFASASLGDQSKEGFKASIGNKAIIRETSDFAVSVDLPLLTSEFVRVNLEFTLVNSNNGS